MSHKNTILEKIHDFLLHYTHILGLVHIPRSDTTNPGTPIGDSFLRSHVFVVDHFAVIVDDQTSTKGIFTSLGAHPNKFTIDSKISPRLPLFQRGVLVEDLELGHDL